LPKYFLSAPWWCGYLKHKKELLMKDRFCVHGIVVTADEKIIKEYEGDQFQIIGIERRERDGKLVPVKLDVSSLKSGKKGTFPVEKFRHYEPKRAIDAPGILATCA